MKTFTMTAIVSYLLLSSIASATPPQAPLLPQITHPQAQFHKDKTTPSSQPVLKAPMKNTFAPYDYSAVMEKHNSYMKNTINGLRTPSADKPR